MRAVERAHFRVEALRVSEASASTPKQCRRGAGPPARRTSGAARPPRTGVAFVDRMAAAVRRRHLRHEPPASRRPPRRTPWSRRCTRHVPKAHGHVRNREVVQEVEVGDVEDGIRLRGLHQAAGQRWTLSETASFSSPKPMSSAACPPAGASSRAPRRAGARRSTPRARMRVGNLDVDQQVDVLLEEAGFWRRNFGDLFRGQQEGSPGAVRRSSISPRRRAPHRPSS